MVVLEAMAHQLPVVVSNADFCGISHELTTHHNAVLLADPRDPQALAEALQAILCADPTALRRLKDESFEFAAQHSWQAAALRYEALYHRVATHESL